MSAFLDAAYAKFPVTTAPSSPPNSHVLLQSDDSKPPKIIVQIIEPLIIRLGMMSGLRQVYPFWILPISINFLDLS